MSQILRITRVPTIARPQAMATPMSLVDDLAAVAVHQAERQDLAGGILESVVDGAGGEDAGEDGAQGSARAVDAEGIQGVVIAEPGLHAGDHEVADHAGAASR